MREYTQDRGNNHDSFTMTSINDYSERIVIILFFLHSTSAQDKKKKLSLEINI